MPAITVDNPIVLPRVESGQMELGDVAQNVLIVPTAIGEFRVARPAEARIHRRQRLPRGQRRRLRARLHQTIDLRYQPAAGGPEKTVTVTLAAKLGKQEGEIRRWLDLDHATKIETLEGALAALGRRISCEVRAACAPAAVHTRAVTAARAIEMPRRATRPALGASCYVLGWVTPPRRWLVVCAVNRVRGSGVQRVIHQRGFTRTRHTGDASEQAHREIGSDVLQIVATRTTDANDLML